MKEICTIHNLLLTDGVCIKCMDNQNFRKLAA
jgi:hypothetical protein